MSYVRMCLRTWCAVTSVKLCSAGNALGHGRRRKWNALVALSITNMAKSRNASKTCSTIQCSTVNTHLMVAPQRLITKTETLITTQIALKRRKLTVTVHLTVERASQKIPQLRTMLSRSAQVPISCVRNVV